MVGPHCEGEGEYEDSVCVQNFYHNERKREVVLLYVPLHVLLGDVLEEMTSRILNKNTVFLLVL